MTHWMDSGSFTDDRDIDAPPLKTWDPATLIAAQLASRFTPLGDWIRQGTCTGDVDKTLWDGVDDDTPGSPRELAARQRAAASLCAGCPVRAQCLADARVNEATVGTIRGGVLFSSRLGGGRTEHNLIDLMHRRLLSDSPAGRGRTAASTAA